MINTNSLLKIFKSELASKAQASWPFYDRLESCLVSVIECADLEDALPPEGSLNAATANNQTSSLNIAPGRGIARLDGILYANQEFIEFVPEFVRSWYLGDARALPLNFNFKSYNWLTTGY